jgi:hypothetical protein
MILPHLTSTVETCHATPHTPKRVVVWQLQCPTCPTFAEPQVWQVWQPVEMRGIDLLISSRVLIFNSTHSGRIERGCHPGLAARVTQRVFVLVRYQGPPNSRTNPRPSYGLPARLIFPCASRAHSALARTSHNPPSHNETYHRHHLFDDQKDIYARAVTTSFTLLDQYRASQASISDATSLAKRLISMDCQEKDPGGGVGGPGSPAAAIIDLSVRYSAALSQILGRPVLKKLGPRP